MDNFKHHNRWKSNSPFHFSKLSRPLLAPSLWMQTLTCSDPSHNLAALELKTTTRDANNNLLMVITVYSPPTNTKIKTSLQLLHAGLLSGHCYQLAALNRNLRSKCWPDFQLRVSSWRKTEQSVLRALFKLNKHVWFRLAAVTKSHRGLACEQLEQKTFTVHSSFAFRFPPPYFFWFSSTSRSLRFA